MTMMSVTIFVATMFVATMSVPIFVATMFVATMVSPTSSNIFHTRFCWWGLRRSLNFGSLCIVWRVLKVCLLSSKGTN